ncbi:MAG: rhodanese-like domain-containing protein [Candidatus Cyclobacteriaceae bacterium M2_1C_046]
MAQADFDKMLKGLYKETVPLITPEEFKNMISNEEVIILDTRSIEEYEVSHVKSAQFISYKGFNAANIPSEFKDKKVVVYCSVGYRSERVGEQLQKEGFKDVVNLYGGIFKWVNDGNEVVNQNNTPTDSVHTYNKKWSKWLEKGVKVYE